MKRSKHPPICAACRLPPEPSVEVSQSRSRWLFVLSGLSAAAISAALTWFLVISPQRQQKSQPAPEDLATVVEIRAADRSGGGGCGEQHGSCSK